MATLICPLVPGGKCHGIGGSSATVQPQDVVTLLITTSDGDVFVKLKVKGAEVSPGFAVYDLLVESQERAVS